MRLYIKNIGMIREATILLNGLTVVAGKNDSGKSTVGKVLYCLIKSLNTFRNDHNKFLSESMMTLFVDANRYFRNKATTPLLKEMINKIEPGLMYEKLYNTLSKNQYKDAINILENYSNEINKISDIINDSENIFVKIYTKQIRDFIKYDLNNASSDEYKIKRTLRNYLQAEFKNDISNKYFDNESSIIKLFDGEIEIIEIILRNNEIIKLFLYNRLFINDITYVESPVCMKKSFSTFHTTKEFDLDTKLKTGKNIDKLNVSIEKRSFHKITDSHEISDIINGNIFYNQIEREFNYQKKDNIRFNETNTAMGIKSFGILDILTKHGFVDNQKIIIIDEPEVHLHPEWQVEYFKHILNLSLNYGCFILINSHSPYIIQAANSYYKKLKTTIQLKENLNFYFSEKEKNSTIIRNYNDNIGEIFATLSKPLEDLFWGEY